MSEEDLELVVPASDLEFKVQVPAGCVIVAALRLPSGQLIELADLVAEDAAGIPVVVPGRELTSQGVGPVDEERVQAAKDAERGVRDAVKGPGRGKKHALADLTHPETPEHEDQAVRDALRAKMVSERPDLTAPDPRLCECVEVLAPGYQNRVSLEARYSPELAPEFLELPKDED